MKKEESKLVIYIVSFLIGVIVGLVSIAIASCTPSQSIEQCSKEDTVKVILKPKF